MGAQGGSPFLFRPGLPSETYPGGGLTRVDAHSFPVVAGSAGSAALLVLERDGLRVPHWHPDAWEFDYCVSGRARMSVVAPGGVWDTFDVEPGDVVFVPQGYFHYIENVGDGPLTFLLVFNADVETDIGLAASVGGVPHEVLAPSLAVPEAAVKVFPEIHHQAPILSRRGAG